MSDEIDVLKREHPLRGFFSDTAFILRHNMRISPLACILTFAETVARITGELEPVLIGLFVAAISRHDASLATWAVVIAIATWAASALLALTGIQARIGMQEKSSQYFDEQIALISGHAPTLEHLERPEYAKQVQILHDQRGTLGNAFNTFANSVHDVAGPATALVVALGADLRMGILVVLSFGYMALAKPQARWDKEAEEKSAEPGKLVAHLQDLVLQPTPGAEMRVLGARGTILDLIRAKTRAWRDPQADAATKSVAAMTAIDLVYFSTMAGVLAWITYNVVGGRVGVGHYATALTAALGLRRKFAWIAPNVQMVIETMRSVARFRWLERYAAEATAAHHGVALPPDTLQHGITLEDVTFTYPGSNRVALDHVDLQIPAGSVVAVVRENGAGKSTLVKALTGMYDLTGGRVLVDGVPLTDLDLAAWRERCSGAFQDHVPFELTARETIGLGDLPHIDDDARIHRALEDAAASDVLAALPRGLDTELGTRWEDGVGLSGGQWQRLAIARGMMRDDPLLLVLDEPTSALDAATEDRLFSGYTSAARTARRRGAITILVTHRFSTVSAADTVVVMADGQIVEQGSHAELVAAGGHYAELYALQAAGYSDSPTRDDMPTAME